MAASQDISMKDTFNECLSQQVSEYEVLKSIYMDPGEIVLTDKHIIDDINNFMSNQMEHIPDHLDYKLNLQINSLKLEVFINLPSLYPKKEPDIYVRCNQMNRASESRLNSELVEYIKVNYFGEVCVYSAINWLQENIDKFISTALDSKSVSITEIEGEHDEFARFWIYSHHIYCKRKREEILKRARDLKLTGFSLPGKPGIICVEGYHNDCKEWWRYIKSMTWQKIGLKKTEVFTLCEEKSYKKFPNFEELSLNMKDLAKFMNELGLSSEFNELFGLCNDD